MRNAKDSATRRSPNNEPASGEMMSPDALKKLRDQWDVQLACLTEPGAADRLRIAMKTSCRLGGEVIAGKTF